jgi:hypothetical protein
MQKHQIKARRKMKTPFFSAVFLMTLFAPAAHAQDRNADIYGQWKITTVLGGGIGSLSASEERKLIGKPLLISAHGFAFNGRKCVNPAYERHHEAPGAYFAREWHTNVSDIPFPKLVTIIKTRGCDYVFPIRKDRLMIAEQGTFFEAVRVRHVSGK